MAHLKEFNSTTKIRANQSAQHGERGQFDAFSKVTAQVIVHEVIVHKHDPASVNPSTVETRLLRKPYNKPFIYLSRPPPQWGGLDLDSRSSGCARLGGEVAPPLGVVVEEVAVLVVLVRRHCHAVRAAVRRAVDDETYFRTYFRTYFLNFLTVLI